MATINNIKKRADEIKNAYEPESVTAEKVGQLFEDIADVTVQTITSSEEVMQESVRAATQAAQAAEDASGYLSDLQDAIQDLPDGQAVTAEVAQHTMSIEGLEGATTLGQDAQGNAVKPSDVMKVNVEEEYVYTLTDKDNHILMGITKEGKAELMGKDVLGNISLALEGALEAIHATMLDEDTSLTDVQFINESVEWIKLIQDADGGILFGIRTDGSIYWSKGVPDVIKEYVNTTIASKGGGGSEGGGYDIAFLQYSLDRNPLCRPLEPIGEYSYVISDSTFTDANNMVVLDSNNNIISA